MRTAGKRSLAARARVLARRLRTSAWLLAHPRELVAARREAAAVARPHPGIAADLSEHERALTRYVQRLEGLLPICAFCKSIRNKDEQWEPLETFISTRSDAEFSHGFCPTCVKTHYQHLSAEEAVNR